MDNIAEAYLAGLFDGEGCICIGVSLPSVLRGNKSPSHWLQVGITNTNRELIDWLYKNHGGHISYNSQTAKLPNKRPCWAWRIMANKAIPFLEAIYPYLRIKQRQAKLAIEFQKERCGLNNTRLTADIIDKRQWYRLEIQRLNRP